MKIRRRTMLLWALHVFVVVGVAVLAVAVVTARADFEAASQELLDIYAQQEADADSGLEGWVTASLSKGTTGANEHFEARETWAGVDHARAVKRKGAEPCFGCHTPQQCAGCHVPLSERSADTTSD